MVMRQAREGCNTQMLDVATMVIGDTVDGKIVGTKLEGTLVPNDWLTVFPNPQVWIRQGYF